MALRCMNWFIMAGWLNRKAKKGVEWIYNNTRRSILAVILLHAMVNFTGEIIAITQRADAVSILLWVVAAVGIVVLWGPNRFMGKQETIP
jgi:hypothetical protein